MLEHGYLKIMPAGVTAGIQVLTQPLRNDDVDYNGLLFRRDTILRRPAQPAAYLPSVAGVSKGVLDNRPKFRRGKTAVIEWGRAQGQRGGVVGGRGGRMPRPA